jgi:hypothetical protein
LQGQTKERLMQLCELAASERDPDKYAALYLEVEQMLEEKWRRLSASSTRKIPACWMCGKAVSLEACKVDEHGRAVHDDCYALMLRFRQGDRPTPE